jgi:hypothetical protein
MTTSRGFSRRILSAALVALSTSGCGESPPELGWTTIVDTLGDGTRRVVHVPPRSGGVVGTLQEELRIGSVDGGGPAAFGRIKGVQILAAGHIAVLDAMAKEIRVFDSFGQHLATFGGEGEGPGEFREPFGLMQDGTGRLWVPDFRIGRMSVVDPESGFQESFRLTILGYGFIWDGALTVDGHILEPSITLGPPRRNVLRVYDQAMTLVDSLPLPDSPPYDRKDPPGAFYWEAPGGTAMGYVGVPFYPFGIRLLDSRGGVWSTELGDFEYRVKYWHPGGDTLLIVESQRPPVAIPASERDSLVAALREQLRQRGAADQDWSKIPQVRPAVMSMFLSDEGDLWVETPTASGTTLYDRYDRNGTYLGSVESWFETVSGLRPVVRGDQLWAVVADDLDIQYVVRARVVPAVPHR